jgi:DNA-binding GntR family transcriptional regulator
MTTKPQRPQQAQPSSQPTHADLTHTLRSDILDGKLPPGERLVELQLAELHRVSRASVRAAIGELVKEGLVEHEANKGATVRRVTIEEAIQITEVRALLESLIAARAAKAATEADRRELSSIIEHMRDAVVADELIVYSELNSLLHRRLREISGHAVAGDLVALLRNRAAHHNFRLALIPGRPNESLPQHQAIVKAVVAGNAKAAERAMREHMESVAAVLRRWAAAGAS